MSSRALTATEQTWSRALTRGTGTTVLVLQMAKPFSEAPLLREILSKLQNSHPALATKLHHDSAANEWSFVEPSRPSVEVRVHDLKSTSTLLKTLSTKQNSNNALTPCHLLLEREMNVEEGSWSDPGKFPHEGINVICAGVYALSEAKCAIVLRLHASVCDRTTAVSLLRELMELTAEADGVTGKGTGKGISNDGEGKMGIEGMIPVGKAKKTIWAHGVDMLGYSVNSFRLSNLKFKDTKMPRFSEVVRMQMDARQTAGIFAGCKSRGIKLCGALAAAALIAAHSTKNETDQLTKKKYGVVTLIDCRPHLEPALSPNHYGFYHAAVLNTHTLKGSEIFWDLASQTYTDFLRYKKCNKHFSDMADISFLMRKAMDNPTLTASSSLRTSLVSVFEDPVIDDSGLMRKSIGVEDYVGCASLHGVGPSLGIFDTVRDGQLDCAFVYPSPLHSREQIAELVGRMKKILVQESSN
ncbi:Ras guanine nucleotide exchange factor L [Striga asiatica]|uniref:Ras guanine nucleotide exchange factor L n=1 Tax=Striga asiatica TaxID=4170 RepID=A0A5A7P8J0_STRAF|nr:Ras guanine nucleotide exchange factor L [Striga asiatica]